ncbi:MAG TPA: response regulator [Mariprofundaceae bacterium]|nr:response regulator [Mariprofundaceae bacterium]
METFGPLKILVVDDDEFVLSALADFLEMIGHHPLPLRDSREAIRLFDKKEDDFDLLITDICMPGINGLQLIRKVRETNSQLPIIVITGYAENEDLEQIAHLKVPVFTKPVNLSKLAVHLSHPSSEA